MSRHSTLRGSAHRPSSRAWRRAGAALLLWATMAGPATACATMASKPAGTLHFDFSGQSRPGVTAVTWTEGGVPLYDDARGHGFVGATSALPARTVHTAGIRATGKGVEIAEPAVGAGKGSESTSYNNFGMAFRIRTAPGAYTIRVRTTSAAPDTVVAISGMQTSRLFDGNYWDAARLAPKRTRMQVDGRQWRYDYVNGQPFIDIEVEPTRAGVPVGIEEIEIVPIAPKERPAQALPTVFMLGDSTVKSYTFAEAPQSGWGQVIDRLFDLSKVRLVNYSEGGRSFRSAYAEGRLNDLLMAGHRGDVVMIQFGHNDEAADEMRRFGGGATETMYETMIREVYLPAIRARGMVPVLVTPMARAYGGQKPGQPYANSFGKRRFPDVMRRVGAAEGVSVVDLNARSVEFYNEAGFQAVTAMVMSIEAGESPGRTNDGSYANGHPANRMDVSHFKEAMARQHARMIVTELARLAGRGDEAAVRLADALRPEVKAAITAGDWSAVYPEIASDIRSGEGAYYRNQIEKLLQLGVLRKDGQGKFDPQGAMDTAEFAAALGRLLQPSAGAPASGVGSGPAGYPAGPLTREVMAAIVDDAYHRRFKDKPRYMTAFNGKTVVPGMPGYDPNLDTGARGAMYYPLVDWSQLTDTAAIAPAYTAKVRDAYALGLVRAEKGIARGRMVNGLELEPKAIVTRAKAAKALYFMWVLAQPVDAQSGVLPAREPASRPASRPGTGRAAR